MLFKKGLSTPRSSLMEVAWSSEKCNWKMPSMSAVWTLNLLWSCFKSMFASLQNLLALCMAGASILRQALLNAKCFLNKTCLCPFSDKAANPAFLMDSHICSPIFPCQIPLWSCSHNTTLVSYRDNITLSRSCVCTHRFLDCTRWCHTYAWNGCKTVVAICILSEWVANVYKYFVSMHINSHYTIHAFHCCRPQSCVVNDQVVITGNWDREH